MSVDVFQLRLLWHPESLISVVISNLESTPENPVKLLCFRFFRAVGCGKQRQI